MKISKLFHWLYCLVMFLPVLFIPIMAIYSHRHTIDSYSVTREKYQVADFNQLIDFDTSLYWEKDNSYELTFNDVTIPSYVILDSFTNNFTDNDIIILRYYYSNVYDGVIYTYYGNGFVSLTKGQYTEVYTTYRSEVDNLWVVRTLTDDDSLTGNQYDGYLKFNFFNLTKMFGSGNEPSLQDFNAIFPIDYYEYTTSKKVLVPNGTETLNNTDIGSQFVYDTYNVVDKYFNYDYVFNFGDLYGWLQITFFSGNAPLGFFIFFHLLEYWLLTSLLWLIFDILIYVPQLCHRWLDKASLE